MKTLLILAGVALAALDLYNGNTYGVVGGVVVVGLYWLAAREPATTDGRGDGYDHS